MIYVKAVLIGFGAVLLGCLVASFGMTFWSGLTLHGAAAQVSYSPRGLAQHLGHSLGFWTFLILLFAAGFVPSAFLRKR